MSTEQKSGPHSGESEGQGDGVKFNEDKVIRPGETVQGERAANIWPMGGRS